MYSSTDKIEEKLDLRLFASIFLVFFVSVSTPRTIRLVSGVDGFRSATSGFAIQDGDGAAEVPGRATAPGPLRLH